jgi:phage FluMu protein Com
MEYRCQKCSELLKATNSSGQPLDKRYAPIVIVEGGDEVTVQECPRCGHTNKFKMGQDDL